MTTFQKLFGIKESDIKNTCVLLPILRKDVLNFLGVKQPSKGLLYSSGNSKSFTVIHTGIGSALLGDSVLYLGETSCQNIILFGSCGLVKEEKDLKIGSVVAPSECYSLESFTGMLLKDKNTWRVFHPDSLLLEKFLAANKSHNIKKTTCATLGSLKLEENYTDIFTEKSIHIVDMECSSFFSASKYIARRAMALFYVTDILNKKPFYAGLKTEDKTKLSSSIKTAASLLCEFIEKVIS